MINLTEVNHDLLVYDSDGVVVLYFTAPWCVPCKMLRPRLEELEADYKGLTIGRVDVDTNGELATGYRIMSVPTLVLLRDGEEVGRHVGGTDKRTLINLFEPHM